MDRGRRRERAQVLDPAAAARHISIGRGEPPPDLAAFVDYLWWVEWSTNEPHVQRVIPRPTVHLAAEMHDGEPRLLVHGASTHLFERRLHGVGRTIAAAFRPGGFAAFHGDSAASLVDRVVPAEEVLQVDDRLIAAQLLDPAHRPEDAADALASWLLALEPPADPMIERVARLVERSETDRTMVRSSQLAEVAGVSDRTLQRWFRSSVGVSPKSVIQQHRLLDVAATANAGGEVDWAETAAVLGYADQSHLIRHFREVVGEPPARYRAALSPPDRSVRRSGPAHAG